MDKFPATSLKQGERVRILLITTTLPWPLKQSGTAQRSGLLLRALQNWGHVDVLVASVKSYFDQPEVRKTMEDSKAYGIRTLELDFTREAGPWRLLTPLVGGKLRNLLKDLGRCKADFSLQKTTLSALSPLVQEAGYDVVVTRYLRCATKTGAAFLSERNVVLDCDDIDWLMHRSQEEQALERSTGKRLRDECTRRYLERMAKKALGNFTHVWAASEDDRAEIGVTNCSVLPNVPILPPADMSGSSKEMARGDTILFVATLGYAPNTQGLDRFLSRIWPAVHQAHPEVRLEVVGTPPEDSQRMNAWKQVPNVDFLGFVDDLDEVYARALFTIAPIYWGGGTKIKVLESLGRGRACVATRHALHGVSEHIRHDDSVWCADSDEEFIQGCISLIENPELRMRMEIKGAEVVQRHYSIETFNRVVDDVMCQFQEGTATGKA